MKITKKEKRFLIWGGAVAAILIIYALTPPMPNSESLSQSVENKKRLLRQNREMLSREETYNSQLNLYKKLLSQDLQQLLPGNNPNVAGAELQKVLQNFADQSGVEITQKNILPDKEAKAGLVKISVRIETNCNPEQLVQLLTAIENYEKFLTVDEFTISSFRVQRNYRIRPSLTVSGYIDSRSKPAEEDSTACIIVPDRSFASQVT